MGEPGHNSGISSNSQWYKFFEPQGQREPIRVILVDWYCRFARWLAGR